MASGDEDTNDLIESDDYYAWLGLSKEASKEEINNAFRKMSRIYHPDKHSSEEMKSKAETLFNKIRKAHEVLADPHKKAIYDTTGIKGLETDGWELVMRTRTPQEILDEFERLQKEREERRLQQRTNPRGTVTVGIDATDVFNRYKQYEPDSQLFPHIEISEMSITQSFECPLTVKDTLVLGGNLSSRNGTGIGSVSASFRRVINHISWAEAELSAGNGVAFAIRGFRTLWRRGYCTMTGSLQLNRHGQIRPACNMSITLFLDCAVDLLQLRDNVVFSSSMIPP